MELSHSTKILKSYADVTFLRISIENHSRLSIAITQMTSRIEEENIVCTATPTEIKFAVRRIDKEIIGTTSVFSSPLPIPVAGMSACSALVLFEGMSKLPQNSATHLPVQVCTTRGRPLEMKWSLPAGWASRRTPE